MQKCLIFLAVLFSTSVWAGLDWNPYVMSHERFVHLSSEDKELVIVKTMEMIVEMESKYRKSVVLNQPDKALFEDYMVLVKKLQNLLISEAYADVDDKFITRAKQFNYLLGKLGTNACIYAGYVSKLVDGRCVSPGMIPKNSKNKNDISIRNAYLTSANANANKSGKCEGATKISCNPVIFGFKQVGSSTPFCVNTSPSEAHNAAYECMRVALTDNKDDKLTDSKDKRLDNLKAALSDSTASGEFNKVHKFIFKTCMCNENTGLNTAYKEYMKPHRTCFGMLNTLNSIDSKECSTLKSKTALDSFGEQWSNYFGATSFESQKAEKNVGFDSVYKDIISKPEMQRLCTENPDAGDDEEDTEGNDCSTECKKEIVDTKEVVYCTVSTIKVKKKVNGKIESSEVKEFKEVKLLLEAGKTELTYVSKDGKNSYLCKVEAPEADDKLSCSLAADFADPKKPVITLKFLNLKEGQKEPAITWAGLEGAVDAKDPKIFNGIATAEEKELVATFAPEGTAPTKEELKQDVKDLKKKYNDQDNKDKKTEASTPAASPAGSGDNVCKISIKEGEASGDKDKYSITTSLLPHAPADLTVKVHAVVKLPEGKTLPADYQIVWIRQGFKGPAPEVKKETPTSKAEDTNGTTPATVTTTPETPAATPPVASATPGAAEADIEETRMTDIYSTCAQLLDGAKKPVSDSCQKIPAMDKPAAPSGPTSRPPVFMTPSYNTRTMGVQ